MDLTNHTEYGIFACIHATILGCKHAMYSNGASDRRTSREGVMPAGSPHLDVAAFSLGDEVAEAK
jgi:hypothetical protein